MTDTVQIVVAAFAAIPPTLVALAGLRQGRSNHQQGAELATKTDEIHVLTNANLTKVTADLALANQRIADLEQLVSAMHQRQQQGGAIDDSHTRG